MSSNDAIKSLLGTSKDKKANASPLDSPALGSIASNSAHVVTGVSNINNALLKLIKSWGG